MDELKFLTTKCPDLLQLFPNVRNIEDTIESWEGGYISVKGQIQSGKTNFMIRLSMLFLLSRIHVLIMVRNQNADKQQLKDRFDVSLVEFYQHFQKRLICNTHPSSPTEPSVFLCLGNSAASKKMEQALRNVPYVLMFDEADLVDSGEGPKKYEFMQSLKANARCSFGISATVMDLLGKESGFPSTLLLLSTPPDYKGFMDLVHVPICTESFYSGQIGSNLLEQDPGLDDFVFQFSTFSLPSQPCIGLLNICRTKRPCYRAVQELSGRYPTIQFAIYNGDGLVSKKGRGPIIEHQGSISQFLQELKDQGETSNILIFSGDLAGRGISFVSSDYQWHLTHERLLVAKGCDECEILQRLRLLGRYKDDLPLTLYATPSLLCDLRKAYFRQEELVANVKERMAETRSCREILAEIPMCRDKFSKRPIVKDKKSAISYTKSAKDDGWNVSVYAQHELPPTSYFMLNGMVPPDEEKRERYQSMHENDVAPKKSRVVVEGDFLLIDSDRIARGTIKFAMVEETIKQIIDHGMVGTMVSRVDVNEWLVRMDKLEFKNVDQLNGNWNSISNGQDYVDEQTREGLLYWKEEDRYYFKLN